MAELVDRATSLYSWGPSYLYQFFTPQWFERGFENIALPVFRCGRVCAFHMYHLHTLQLLLLVPAQQPVKLSTAWRKHSNWRSSDDILNISKIHSRLVLSLQKGLFGASLQCLLKEWAWQSSTPWHDPAADMNTQIHISLPVSNCKMIFQSAWKHTGFLSFWFLLTAQCVTAKHVVQHPLQPAIWVLCIGITTGGGLNCEICIQLNTAIWVLVPAWPLLHKLFNRCGTQAQKVPNEGSSACMWYLRRADSPRPCCLRCQASTTASSTARLKPCPAKSSSLHFRQMTITITPCVVHNNNCRTML